MSHRTMNRLLLAAGILALALATARAGTNLVVNGSFSNTNDPLTGWKYDYRDTDNSWYADNHEFVSVVEQEGPRRNVLSLKATGLKLDGSGVKVDSQAIPMVPNAKYKFSVWARSIGSDCRIMIEGYTWRPGIKPHANPEWWELRKCYKFHQLYFGNRNSGTKGGVLGSWSQASRTFPDDDLSELSRKNLEKVRFFVIHMVALGGNYDVRSSNYYYLFVDDVVLEQLN